MKPNKFYYKAPASSKFAKSFGATSPYSKCDEFSYNIALIKVTVGFLETCIARDYVAARYQTYINKQL